MGDFMTTFKEHFAILQKSNKVFALTLLYFSLRSLLCSITKKKHKRIY